MKTRHFIFAALSIIAASCTNDEPAVSAVEEVAGRQLTLTASMPPASEAKTRLVLTETTEGAISVNWEAGDKISLCFVKGETVKTLHDIAVTNIREENGRSKADFSFSLPAGITYPFDLYGVYGATLNADSKTVNLSSVLASNKTLTDAAPVCAMRFEAKNLTEGAPVSVNFRHLGALLGVWLTNSGGSAYTFQTLALSGNDDYKWIYDTGTANYDIALGQIANAASIEEKTLTYSASTALSIEPGTTVKLYRWMVPVATPDESKTITATWDGVPMPESLPAKSFAAGIYYRLKLMWNGTKWIKPMIDNLTLPGSLMHAANGSNFVGVVYSKGDGKIYYNAARTNATWEGEIELGTGSEARIAIGGGYPHVVFTTDNKIAYRKYSGTTWTDAVYIESNDGGQCSKPDIDVANGNAHITYTDTRGQNGNYTDHPDIMYATNGSGSFVKTVIRNGYYESYGGADAGAEYYNKGSYIAVDGTQNYYIITHRREYSKGMGWSSRSYSTRIFTSKNSASGGTSDSSSDNYNIYDIAFNGSDIVALYNDNTDNCSAVIGVSGSTASFTNPQSITTAVTPHGISASSSGTLVVGITNENKLFTRYGVTEATHAGITVQSSGSRTAAVHLGTVFFVAYTDQADGKIKFMRL